MKFPDLMCRMAFKASLPSSLQTWLGQELETRGIDGGIYTRYIISLLQQDSTESDESDNELSGLWPLKAESGRINQRKSHRKKSTTYSEEDRKKLAAIDYLISICEDAEGIETLVEELSAKLKQPKYKIDKENIKGNSICNKKVPAEQCSHTQEHATKPQNATERYCKAFPDLHGKISAITIPPGSAHNIWKYNPISVRRSKGCEDHDRKAISFSNQDRMPSSKSSRYNLQNTNQDSKRAENDFHAKSRGCCMSSIQSRLSQRKRPYRKLKVQAKGKHKSLGSKGHKASGREGLLKEDTSQKSPKLKSIKVDDGNRSSADHERCKQLEMMLKEILFQPRDFSSPNNTNPVMTKDSDSGWVTTSECTPVIGLLESENKENEYWYTHPLEDVPFKADAPKHLYKRHSYPPTAHNSLKDQKFVKPPLILCEERFWHFDDDVFLPFPLELQENESTCSDMQRNLQMQNLLEESLFHIQNGGCGVQDLWNSSDESGLEVDKNTDQSQLLDDSDSPGDYSSFSDTSQVVTESALSVLDSSPEDKMSEENPVTLVDSNYLMESLGLSTQNCLLSTDFYDVQYLSDIDKDGPLTLLDSEYLLQSFSLDAAHLFHQTAPEKPPSEKKESGPEKSSMTLLDPNYLLHFTNIFTEPSDCIFDGHSVFEKVRYPSVLPDLMLPREWPLKKDIWNECLFVNSFENTKYSLPENNSILQQLWNINIQRNKRWSFTWTEDQSNPVDLFNGGITCLDSFPQNKTCSFLFNTGSSPSYNTLIPEISLSDINGDNSSGSVLHFCSPVKQSYSDCMKNVSLNDVNNMWSFSGIEKYSSLSKSFDLIPSECSAFDGVIPKARSIHHVLSEPILSQYAKETNRFYSKSHSSCNSYKEHLYFSAATHFRPIQTPFVTPISEDICSVTKDLFGGLGHSTESPYQHYHKDDVEYDDSFIPKFKLQSDRHKYIQTGRSLDEDSSTEENDVKEAAKGNCENERSEIGNPEQEDCKDDDEGIELGVSELDLESCVNMICSEEDVDPHENVPFPEFEKLKKGTETGYKTEKEKELISRETNPKWKQEVALGESNNPSEKTYGIWSYGNEKYIPFIEDFISDRQEETLRMIDVCDVISESSFYVQETPNPDGGEGEEVSKCIDYASNSDECIEASNIEKSLWDRPASPVENIAVEIEMDPYTAFMQFDDSLIFQFSDDLESEKRQIIQGAVFSTDLEKEWLSSGGIQKSKQKLKPRFAKKPCSFYMEGNCDRTECKYSHDLSNITCRFWEDGCCFKGGTCPFRHGKCKNDSSRPSSSALGLPKQRF